MELGMVGLGRMGGNMARRLLAVAPTETTINNLIEVMSARGAKEQHAIGQRQRGNKSAR